MAEAEKAAPGTRPPEPLPPAVVDAATLGPSALDLDGETFRRIGHALVDTLGEYLDRLSDGPVYRPLPPEVRRRIDDLALPADGLDPDEIVAFFERHVLPYGRGQNHPCFAAFVDPAASKMSMLAAFAAAVTNTSGAGGNYAAVHVERTVVRWLMELVGFPVSGSDGVLLGGGSDANRHCMEVARYWAAQREGWDVRHEGLHGRPRLTMYVSDEGHSCIDKAAFTLGLGAPRRVAVDDDFRLRPDALAAAVAADRAAGLRPFLVVASAGSVKTGAIDPLDEVADICQREDLWLHVDGAYGGLGVLDPRLAPRYAGLARASSLALDPHKWLAVAIGCSCAMVRQGTLLEATYKLVPSYLDFRRGHGFAGEIWYSHRSAEQTRDAGRALKVLWNIQQAGRDGLVALVRRHVDLARSMERLIEGTPALELVASGPLTAVCFRYRPQGADLGPDALDELNRAIAEDVQIGGDAFVTGTEVRGRYVLRSCAMHYALSERHVETILRAVRDAGDRLTAAPAPCVPLAHRAARASAPAPGDAAATRTEQHRRITTGGRAPRLVAAVGAGKLASRSGRLLGVGGGTSLPGKVARRIDPSVLRKLAGEPGLRTLIMTGTNGKTTSCRMVSAVAEACDTRVAGNRTGSNLIQGVTAAAVQDVGWDGHLRAQLLVLEVDEATVSRVVAEVAPAVVVLTNLFRDQLDRYGELYSVAKKLEAAVGALPETATVVLNADDPLVASLASAAPARRVYFGLRVDDVGDPVPEHAADSVRCPRCHRPLHYERAYVSHLGAYGCRSCGHAPPPLDVEVTSVRAVPGGGSAVGVRTPIGHLDVGVALPGLHNVYNVAGALAAATALGLDVARGAAAIASVRPAFGRQEEIHAPDHRLVLAFVKNPTAYNTTLRGVLGHAGRLNVLAAHDHTEIDGRDLSWLWDVDLEALSSRLAGLVVTGSLAEDVALRFKYAGVDPRRIRVVPDRTDALDAALAGTPPGDDLYVLAGYTPMRMFRRVMEHRGWVAPVWKE